jgi:hypothetical protein
VRGGTRGRENSNSVHCKVVRSDIILTLLDLISAEADKNLSDSIISHYHSIGAPSVARELG